MSESYQSHGSCESHIFVFNESFESRVFVSESCVM